MDFVLPGTYSIVEMEHDLYTQALSIMKSITISPFYVQVGTCCYLRDRQYQY